ncbi:hypothetical protein OCU04_002747 [Sclerotinia nivalis]|uniref:Uncharacterized protein n=1 Tax=Sclerotinia nivalis TaxID=352851 RepID=A0A9X0AXN7_9HELO|nr:hypothetical protein OCU04_002747 [Sclerotinia nivalis]
MDNRALHKGFFRSSCDKLGDIFGGLLDFFLNEDIDIQIYWIYFELLKELANEKLPPLPGAGTNSNSIILSMQKDSGSRRAMGFESGSCLSTLRHGIELSRRRYSEIRKAFGILTFGIYKSAKFLVMFPAPRICGQIK